MFYKLCLCAYKEASCECIWLKPGVLTKLQSYRSKQTACVAYTTVFLEPGRSGTVCDRAINLTFTTGGCRPGSSACRVLHCKCTQTEQQTGGYANISGRDITLHVSTYLIGSQQVQAWQPVASVGAGCAEQTSAGASRSVGVLVAQLLLLLDSG